MTTVDTKSMTPLVAEDASLTNLHPKPSTPKEAVAATAAAVPKEEDATKCDETPNGTTAPNSNTEQQQVVEQIPEEPEPWGDILRRMAKHADAKLRDRVRQNLEGLMRTLSGEQINRGNIKFSIAQVGIPKQATLTDGCEWKALVDDWADGHRLQATFHPILPNCFCIRPTPSKLSCTCIPKITLSW